MADLRDLQPAGSPSIIPLLSGKGGVGKTTIALQLALRASQRGLSTLLIDTDWGSGDLHLLTNAAPTHGVADWVSGEVTLLQCAYQLQANCDLIASLPGHDADQLGMPATALALIHRIRSQAAHYDLVVIDHKSGVSMQSALLAHASLCSLLVCIPELTSLADAYGLFKNLTNDFPRLNSLLIVNRADSVAEGDEIASQLQRLCRRFLPQSPGYLGALPEDPTIRQTTRQRRPSGLGTTGSALARRLDMLVSRLLTGVPTGRRLETAASINRTIESADREGTDQVWLQPRNSD